MSATQTSAATEPLIRIQRVSKVYFTDVVETHAASDVDLEIPDGKNVSIAGPSGGGKSTPRSILVLLDAPGEYRIGGSPRMLNHLFAVRRSCMPV